MTAFVDNVRASAGALKGNTGLRRLSLTATIAELSAPVYYTAALVWAFGAGGAMLAAIFGIVAMLPAAAAAPFLAVVTDRSRKERVMAGSLAARGVLLLVLAAGVALESNWLVLVAAAAASICARTLYPALAALIPSLARSREELVAANALVSGIENVGLVAGPALAGAALVVVSPAAVCAAAALAALAAGAAALRIEAPAASVDGASDAKISVGGELVAGFATILADARTRGVVAVHAVHCLGLGALAVVVVQLAIDDLGLGSAGFGLFEAAIALGGVAGGVVAVGRFTAHDTIACIRGGALVWGVSSQLVAVAVGPATALLGLAALGVGNVLLDVVHLHVRSGDDRRDRARPDDRGDAEHRRCRGGDREPRRRRRARHARDARDARAAGARAPRRGSCRVPPAVVRGSDARASPQSPSIRST